MATYFVSPHLAAHDWLKAGIRSGRQSLAVDGWFLELPTSRIRPGDLVLGTLPDRAIEAVLAARGEFRPLLRNGQPWPTAVGTAVPEPGLAEIQFGPPASRPGAKPMVPRAVRSPNPARTQTDAGGASIRVGFLSDQLAPWLIAALEHRQDASRLLLLVTPRMAGSGLTARLAAAFKRSRLPEPEFVLVPAEILAFTQWVEYLRPLLAQTSRRIPGCRLVLDLTGGTKLMALALTSAAEALQREGVTCQCTYVDTEHLTIEWPLPSRPGMPMRTRLDTEQALLLGGWKVTNLPKTNPEQVIRSRAQATAAIMSAPDSDIDLLHKLAFDAGQKDHQFPHEEFLQHRRDTPALFRELARASLLSIREDSAGRLVSVRFPDFATHRYLAGTWMEEWAWLQVASLGMDDLRFGVQIESLGLASGSKPTDRPTRQELDLVLMHRNRMLVVEVKAGNLRRPGSDGKDLRATDALGKLHAVVAAVRSTYASCMLLTRQAVDPLDEGRAREWRVTLLRAPKPGPQPVTGDPQSAFVAAVRAWMETGNPAQTQY